MASKIERLDPSSQKVNDIDNSQIEKLESAINALKATVQTLSNKSQESTQKMLQLEQRNFFLERKIKQVSDNSAKSLIIILSLMLSTFIYSYSKNSF